MGIEEPDLAGPAVGDRYATVGSVNRSGHPKELVGGVALHDPDVEGGFGSHPPLFARSPCRSPVLDDGDARAVANQ
jgi:hypothetical protein